MNPQEIYRKIGRKIKRYREGTHRTQAQLAAEIGISRASLANIEAGRQQILTHHLYAISDALDLGSPTELMVASQASGFVDVEASELPLPDEGLTEKQRMEVLHLMGGVLHNGELEDMEDDK